MTSARIRRTHWRWFCLPIVLVFAAGDVRGQAPQERPAIEQEGRDATAKSPERRIKEGEFSAAVVMWCGVLAVGILLIAMVVVWGRGLKRMIRRPLKPMTELDPLWYLKQTSRPPTPPDPPADPDRLPTS